MENPEPHRKKVRHFDEPGHIHELTFSCYQRRQLLVDDLIRKLFYKALDRAIKGHDFRLLTIVIMPEHFHLLDQPRTETGRISDLLFAIKRPGSFRIKQHLQETKPSLLETLSIQQRPGQQTFRFWQEGLGYDRNLTEPSSILAALNYIHLNPVRRGLCERAIDWKWSSARYHLIPGMPQTLTGPMAAGATGITFEGSSAFPTCYHPLTLPTQRPLLDKPAVAPGEIRIVQALQGSIQ